MSTILPKCGTRPENLTAETSAETGVSLVAEENGEIVGHAQASDEGGGLLHLRRLYLQSAYHGQGIGDQLLVAALTAFTHGKTASLEVYENNARAVAFYKRHGFKVSEKLRDEFAEDELYEFRMIKPL